MKKVLVILAHSDIESSIVNKRFAQEFELYESVTVKDIKSLYPDYNIDVEKEQDDLRCANKIVFQFPLYWFNSPAILKEYIDKVFDFGFAFDMDENGYVSKELRGKEFMLVVSAGGEEKLYNSDDAVSIEKCLTPFYETAKFTGMIQTESFYTYEAMPELITQDRLDKEAKKYKEAVLA